MVFKNKIISTLLLIIFLNGCGSTMNPEASKIDSEPTPEKNFAQTESTDSDISGEYEAYTPEKFDELYGTEKFILFFHAGWCPTCRALEIDIKDNLSKLNGQTVLEVNYDTETELKKEYGITVQSTVVFINSNGSVFEKRLNPDFELIEKFFL